MSQSVTCQSGDSRGLKQLIALIQLLSVGLLVDVTKY